MRLATYEYRGRRLRGVLDGAAVRPFPGGTSLPGLIPSGSDFGLVTELPPLGDPVAVNGVRLLFQGEDRTEGGRRQERLDASAGNDARGLLAAADRFFGAHEVVVERAAPLPCAKPWRVP